MVPLLSGCYYGSLIPRVMQLASSPGFPRLKSQLGGFLQSCKVSPDLKSQPWILSQSKAAISVWGGLGMRLNAIKPGNEANLVVALSLTFSSCHTKATPVTWLYYAQKCYTNLVSSLLQLSNGSTNLFNCLLSLIHML